MCVCDMCVCDMCEQAPAEISRVCDSLELKSQGVRSYLTWVLGPKLRTSQEKQRFPPLSHLSSPICNMFLCVH